MRHLSILAGLIGGILLFALAFVLIAPDTVARLLVARAAAWSGIDAQGLDTLDVSLGEARISGGPLSFGGGTGKPARVGLLRADLEGAALFSGRVVFEELVLADADAELVIDGQGRVSLNGIPFVASAERGAREEEPREAGKPSAPPLTIQRATIEQVRLDIRRGENASFPLHLDRLRLDDLSAEAPEAAAKFEIAGSGRDVRFSYSGEAKPYLDPIEAVVEGSFENLSLAEVEALAGPLGLTRAEGRLAAEGSHRLTVSPQKSLDVTSNGTLTATGLDIALPGLNAVRLERARLGLDGSATAGEDGRVELSNRAPWEIAGLVVAWSHTGAVRIAEANVDATIDVETLAAGGVAAKIRGVVPLQGHAVAWSDTGSIHLDSGTARLDIEVTKAPDGAMQIAGPMAITGGGTGGIRSGESFRLSYRGINADFPDARIDLAADGTARVEGRPVATLSGFALAAPLSLDAATAVATARSLHVLSPAEGVVVDFRGDLNLEDVAMPVEGEAPLLARTLTFELAPMRYDEEASGASKLNSDIVSRAVGVSRDGRHAVPFPVRDGELKLAGLDLALTPDGGIRRLALAPETQAVLEGSARGRPHHLAVGLDRLEITDLDPGVPDQLTRADIAVTLNQSGRIELTERVKPFVRPPEFIFEGAINSLELPQLSPYVAAATGFNVESGRLAATGRATAEGGKLDGVVDLDIQTLDLVPVAKKGDALESDLIGVPLDLAIALLENSKRKIDVSLPFSGDLSHPEVDYCDVIRTALLGAVRLVVTAVLPGGDSKDQAPALAPVPFDPGSTALNAGAARQLDQVGGMLARKPRLRLQVCGRAAAADARALGAAPSPGTARTTADASTRLLALAQERSRVAAAGLAAVSGVRPDQVQECRAKADATDAGAARADVRF